jgi:peptidyl-prolyl cis-trans isomerase B (cyclophilin B)
VPTNEQRRATARRKLQRQLERRAQQARRRRIVTISAAGVLAVAVAVALIVWFVFSGTPDQKTAAPKAPTTAASAAPAASGVLPPFHQPANFDNCQYPATQEPAAKPVKPPSHTGKLPTDPAQVSVSMVTDQGPVGLMLDQAKTPCTVNSFASLAEQGYFDNTPCHRLTTSASLGVLQCGDPTGQGTGGPGYQFANEYPTNQYPPGDPALQTPIVYPRGTVAMANAGADTNGSQFFLVYKDSQLPPNYTVFGTIQQDGLATLDKIAAAGVAGGGEDGKPATPVTIKSVRVD